MAPARHASFQKNPNITCRSWLLSSGDLWIKILQLKLVMVPCASKRKKKPQKFLKIRQLTKKYLSYCDLQRLLYMEECFQVWFWTNLFEENRTEGKTWQNRQLCKAWFHINQKVKPSLHSLQTSVWTWEVIKLFLIKICPSVCCLPTCRYPQTFTVAFLQEG